MVRESWCWIIDLIIVRVYRRCRRIWRRVGGGGGIAMIGLQRILKGFRSMS